MKQLLLVFRGTPATRDVELDAVVCCISCSLAQGTEQIAVEVGHGRNLVIKDRRAVGDGTVSLARCTTVIAVKSVQRWWPRLASSTAISRSFSAWLGSA